MSAVGAPPPREPIAPQPVPRTGPAIPPPRRRVEAQRSGVSPVVWVLLVLAVLGAGGAGAWYLSQQNGGGREAPPLAGLPDSAMKDTTKQDSLTPADAPRLDAEGRTRLRQGDFAGAADDFRQATELAPDRVDFQDHLAFALIKLGRPQEAASILEQAIRANPNYDLSYSHLADARLAMGDTALALVALDRFMAISISQPDRDAAQRRIDDLKAPRIVAPPPPEIVGGDTTHADTIAIPPASGLRDTIRIPPR